MAFRVPVAGGYSPWARRTAAVLSGALLVAVVGCSSDSSEPSGSSGAPGGGSSGAPSAGANSSGTGGSSAGASPGGSGGKSNVSGSGGADAGGSAGSSGAGGASTAMWTTNGSKYSLSFGSTYFEVDAMLGARITSFKTGGTELLANAQVTGLEDYWGSTFWPSPQSLFNLPPSDPSIANIDRNPYAAVLDGGVLTLTSTLNVAAPKLVVTKKFTADVAKEAIVIEYTMTNGGTTELNVAPWEVTRVAGGGITFYPESSPPVLHDNNLVLPPTTLADGVRWFQHVTSVKEATKFFADGKDGWVAHAAGDLLLIKTFPDIAANQSPAGESEVEIYAVPTYVEVEQQGAAEMLAPGASSAHWTVRWYARKLPAPAAVGSADVVTYVQNQIK